MIPDQSTTWIEGQCMLLNYWQPRAYQIIGLIVNDVFWKSYLVVWKKKFFFTELDKFGSSRSVIVETIYLNFFNNFEPVLLRRCNPYNWLSSK